MNDVFKYALGTYAVCKQRACNKIFCMDMQIRETCPHCGSDLPEGNIIHALNSQMSLYGALKLQKEQNILRIDREMEDKKRSA